MNRQEHKRRMAVYRMENPDKPTERSNGMRLALVDVDQLDRAFPMRGHTISYLISRVADLFPHWRQDASLETRYLLQPYVVVDRMILLELIENNARYAIMRDDEVDLGIMSTLRGLVVRGSTLIRKGLDIE